MRELAGDALAAHALTEAAELALRERAKHHDAFGLTGRDRGRSVGDRTGAAAATAAPLHVGEAQVLDAERRGESRRVAAVVAERSEAVDVLRRDAGVGARGDDGLQRELEFGVGRLAALVVRRFADADDGDRAAQSAIVHQRARRARRCR